LIVPPFRRVETREAGPSALGILVPPGRRTVVILRPRSLAWDLLAALWDGDCETPPVFCTFDRDEAVRVARSLQQALEVWVKVGVNPVETLGDPKGERFGVWLHTDEYVWVLCRRTPGETYQPVVFPTREEARRVAEQLTPIFWPSAGAEQEYYFNTQQFV
jgi:hypothetical protein